MAQPKRILDHELQWADRSCYFCGRSSDPSEEMAVELTLVLQNGQFGKWICHGQCVLPTRHAGTRGFGYVSGSPNPGVMRSYPPPDDESRWEELLNAAASEDERSELRVIRERELRGREQFAQWERDHPRSWWYRLLSRFAPR